MKVEAYKCVVCERLYESHEDVGGVLITYGTVPAIKREVAETEAMLSKAATFCFPCFSFIKGLEWNGAVKGKKAG